MLLNNAVEAGRQDSTAQDSMAQDSTALGTTAWDVPRFARWQVGMAGRRPERVIRVRQKNDKASHR